MRRTAKSLIQEKGATALEFAILSPVFFLLILGIIESGRVFSAWLVITSEAREGARYGVVRYVQSESQPSLAGEIQSHVQSRIESQINPSSLAVDVQVNKTDKAVIVSVDYAVEIVTPLVQNVMPNPFPLHAVSRMRGE